MLPTELITGVPFTRLALHATIETLAGWVDGPGNADGARYSVFANPHSVEVARQDEQFAAAIRAADMVCADGIGIVIASWLLGGGIGERVCGPDIFVGLNRKLNRDRPGTRVFFLGSTSGSLAILSAKFHSEFPNLVISGVLAPAFRDEFSDDDHRVMLNAINQSGAEVVWVGLGSPKQDKWAWRNRGLLHARYIGPVGAAFGFFTGEVKSPPRWTHALGGVTVYRLFQEPGRVWRRNINNPIFLARVIAQRFGRQAEL